ncbi:SH3-like domain-containing protein [Desulfatibacillum alkenivorans DSM 16219]|jgi:SH3-like domain-containing protein|uniref:SH3-like domain-containing protein n=1 Tax=Desulfatibacillum alkenivorans DSM 16219 TaxID=1121393 RepID=A0A1M6IHX2_9BACT|nr:SH3 domain-containing protein [Desulfatibacillum alkenivorans]SHJ34029.1 SH3-like domain-containing protein [Desulfatibacillum alkenivorans DSM 16219]
MKKIVCALAVLFLLMPGLAFAKRMSVAVDKANIRSGPGTNYDIIFRVERYFPVLVEDCVNDWCRFTDVDGQAGWLHRSLLDDVKSVITTKDKCNVRSGPGTNNKKVAIVEAGVPFKVLTTKGRWIKVEHVSGVVGWIHASLVW